MKPNKTLFGAFVISVTLIIGACQQTELSDSAPTPSLPAPAAEFVADDSDLSAGDAAAIARIFRNGLASSQREDGGAGTDTVVFRDQPGFADCDTLSLHGWEAPFCCSMRLAEGLWYAQVNRAMLYCEQELAGDGTPLVRQDQYGRYMCGDYVLAEPSLPEGVAGDWKLPAPLAVTDGHRLSPLVRFYEIPASVAAVLRQRVLF